MERDIYRKMADFQERHWWFCARRELLSAEITRLKLPARPHILEIGCGPGGNLSMLQEHGQVSAMEMDLYARQHATKRYAVHVVEGWLPGNIPFEEGRFDLICLFDVLEHIGDDDSALKVLRRYLSPGGYFLLSAPAYPWLFGLHDRLHHHHRRYTLRGLSGQLCSHGYSIQSSTYFNSVLFPLVLWARAVDFLGSSQISKGTVLPKPWLNKLLYRFFCSEVRLLDNWRLPFGTSVLIAAQSA